MTRKKENNMSSGPNDILLSIHKMELNIAAVQYFG